MVTTWQSGAWARVVDRARRDGRVCREGRTGEGADQPMTTSNRAGTGRTRRFTGGLVLTAAILAGCAAPIAGTASPAAGAAAAITGSSQSSPADSTGPVSSTQTTSSASSPETTASSGTDSPSSEPSPGSSVSSSSQPAAPGSAIDPAAFAAKMQSSNVKNTSMTGSIAVDSSAATVKGTFRESLAGGKVTAIDMKMTVGLSGQSVVFNMLIKDNKAYIGGATIMSALGAGGKKWALASANSSNTQLRTLAAQLNGYLDTASADQYALLASAASSVKDAGEQPLGSRPAHRYEVTVDTARAAALMSGASKTSMQSAADAGIKSIPTTIWLDENNRLVEADSTVALRGVRSTTTFKVTDYDTPVTISAPVASEVYTG